MISFDFPEYAVFRSNMFCSILMCVVSFLMVSRIPTISTKKMKVPTYMFIPMMLIVALFASFVMSQPWLTLGISTLCYAASIPIGVLFFLKEKHDFEKKN